jgi:creatinine amidohydrolase
MKHDWALMTWREVRDRARGKLPVVLVPIACVEPQGPYTPTGMEFLMADALAKAVAKRTESVALPAIPYGHSDDFINIPGTVYIRPETLTMLYEDVYRSVLRAGFTHVLFVAYHIPNQWIIERVARKVREESGILCAWVNPGSLAATYLKDLFSDPTAARGHGAEPGISLMRFLVPEAVNVEQGEWKTPASAFRGLKLVGGAPAVDGVPINLPINWDDLYPDLGGYGNPTLGSADVGRQLFNRLVDDLSKVVVAFRSMDNRVAEA